MFSRMKKPLPIVIGVTFVVSLFAPINSQVSAASVNGTCRKAGITTGTAKKPLVCKKVGKKLVWKAVVVAKAPKSSSSVLVAPPTTSLAPVIMSVTPLTTSVAPVTVTVAPVTASVAPPTTSVAPVTTSVLVVTASTTVPVSAPVGATAKCKDGTYSYSQTRSGTCSYHGGVSIWL